MTTDQAVSRQAAHENLVQELIDALEFFVNHPGVWQLCTPNSEAMESARAVLARAKGQQ